MAGCQGNGVGPKVAKHEGNMGWFRMSLVTTLVACIGCNAEPPGVPAEFDSDEPLVEGSTEKPGDPPEKPQVTLKWAPSTLYYTVPVSGTGPANGTLFYSVGNRGQKSLRLMGDGTFCIDIPIYKDQKLSMVFHAVDALGQRSDQIPIEIYQSGEPPRAEAPAAPVLRLDNVATGDIYRHDIVIKAGQPESTNLGMLADTSTATEVKMMRDAYFFYDNDDPPQLLMKLRKRTRVEHIKITQHSECGAAGPFIYFLADQRERPAFWQYQASGQRTSGPWQRVNPESSNMDLDLTSVDLARSPGPMEAQWFGIELMGNNGLGGNCHGSADRNFETAGISEIEVWGRDARTVVPPQTIQPTNTCGSASSL